METLVKNIELGKYNFLLFLILLLFISLRFVNLNFDDMQTWDESLYAIRTQSVVYHNNWLDQTDDALGGLYSSAHPPLLIWLNAISVKSFGDFPYAYRLPTALLSFFTILFVFFVHKNKLTAFFSSMILSSFYYYYLFSRAGQLDIAFISFITLGVLFYSKYLENKKIKYVIFTGIALGFALYCKIIVGFFLPIGLFTFSVLNYLVNKNTTEFKYHFKNTLIITFIGIAIFTPWFIYMLSKHKGEFIQFYFLYHIKSRLSGVLENNEKRLSYAFYFNQILVYGSFCIPLIVFYFNKLKSNRIFLFSFSVMIVEFVIITISKTKLPTYLLPVLPLLAIMSGMILKHIIIDKSINKMFLIAISANFIWSLSQELRNAIKIFDFTNYISYPHFIQIITSFTFCILTFYFRNNFRNIALIIFVFFILKFVIDDPIGLQTSKLREVSNYAKQNNIELIKYYYSEDRTSYVINPQIKYYFGLDSKIDYIGFRTKENIQFLKFNTDLNKKYLVIIDNLYNKNKTKYIEANIKNSTKSWSDKYYTIFEVANANTNK